MILTFTVYGRPQPQGSMRAFTPKGWTRPILTSTNKNLKSWRQEVAIMAQSLMTSSKVEPVRRPLPVYVSASFIFQKPKSTPKKVVSNTKKPDIEKLCRALADALTGICYDDDSQIVELMATKSYGEPERTEISVRVISELPAIPLD